MTRRQNSDSQVAVTPEVAVPTLSKGYLDTRLSTIRLSVSAGGASAGATVSFWRVRLSGRAPSLLLILHYDQTHGLKQDEGKHEAKRKAREDHGSELRLARRQILQQFTYFDMLMMPTLSSLCFRRLDVLVY